jgi:hypothetical protein
VRMQSTKGLAKAVSSEMADSLKSQEEVLTLALTKAQKDNNTVYLERVPAFAGTPDLAGPCSAVCVGGGGGVAGCHASRACLVFCASTAAYLVNLRRASVMAASMQPPRALGMPVLAAGVAAGCCRRCACHPTAALVKAA